MHTMAHPLQIDRQTDITRKNKYIIESSLKIVKTLTKNYSVSVVESVGR